MLTLVKLTGAEYLITSVASGLEDYYMGSGEAPGVWHGRWAGEVGLAGVVEADQLRAMVNGHDPITGVDWLDGRPDRKVNAFDATLSAPKSASLLWAFGPPEIASAVSIAHVDAVEVALDFLESKAALARCQVDGVRSRAPTHGWAIATFAHRTSRAGDPQLHTHCLIPNVVRRADGTHCAFDAAPLHEWAKAAGSIYQEQLRTTLTRDLGVVWGPDRHGTREMVGFCAEQLRVFSKRSAEIEAYLEAAGERYESPAARMRALDWASRDTRAAKDRGFTPELLRERWAEEARAVGLDGPAAVERLVRTEQSTRPELTREEVFAHLVDPELGLCAHDSRFGEAHVVEAVAALGAGRLDVPGIEALAQDFLASEHVVRLIEVDPEPTRRRPPQWSTVAHRALEDRVLAHLDALTFNASSIVDPAKAEAAIAAEAHLGPDQAEAIRVLCGPGPKLTSLISPAGFGKTTAVHAAAVAAAADGYPVLGVATTNKAVGELRDVGIESVTIARLALDLQDGRCLRPHTVLILDEASQTSTADAEVVLGAVVGTDGAQLWALGDVRQAQSVRAGGLAAAIDRLGHEGAIPAPELSENRRQVDPAEREALAAYRAGAVSESQAMRADQGWEHEGATPDETRKGLAAAAVAAADANGPAAVAVLAASHADCEDLADRIRQIRMARGELAGDALAGPGWGVEPRQYAAGDRVLLHARFGKGAERLHNGSTATVVAVHDGGLEVRVDEGRMATLPQDFVEGRRRDKNPNLSHAWARTVDGSQGGTWTQVHLLGSAALDNFKGYVGQSRSKLPTHTWNVARLHDVDYGGILADDRSPSEEVLGALQRAPLKTFAAADDPWVTDSRLRSEIGAHEAVVATRPADRRTELAEARRAVDGARQELDGAEQYVAGASRRLDEVGPMARLRKEGRASHARAVVDLERATERLQEARQRLIDCEPTVVDLEHAVARRDDWDAEHGWHVTEAARLRGELDHHWAEVVVAAVRQGDPLAFGIESLRAARLTFGSELNTIVNGLPSDRTEHLRRAESHLAKGQQALAKAQESVESAAATLAVTQERHWGRRDKPATAKASKDLNRAERDVVRARSEVAGATERVAEEQTAMAARRAALEVTAAQRNHLSEARLDFDDALATTRPERVAAMTRAEHVPEYVTEVLGPFPETRGGQRTWCALAVEVEEERDVRATRPSSEQYGSWHYLLPSRSAVGRELHECGRDLIEMGAELDPAPGLPVAVEDATSWTKQLDAARTQHEALAHDPVERTLGIELGL